MATFALPRFLQDAKERAEHAKALAKVVQEADGDVREWKRHFAPTAMDALALRGLPAVGRGAASGAIRGTQPERHLIASQPPE